MKQYDTKELRNIGVIAHGGAGKTSLSEAMLFDAESTNRLGEVNNGTSSLDFDPDEIRRKISISSSIGYAEWNKHKINIVDTPGYANFIADTKACLRAVDAAVVIASAISGVKVQTRKVWQFALDYELPRLIFVNKMDRERASFVNALGDIEKALGVTPLPLQLPIGAEHNFKGVVDLIKQKAYIYKNDGSGKFELADIPAEIRPEADKYREKLVEAVVETNDDLMTSYLEGEEVTQPQLEQALREAVVTSQVVPVLCGSATLNMGVQPLLDAIVNYLPSPTDRHALLGKNQETRNPTAGEPFAAQVFKTIVDQHIGKLSLFRVFSGKLNADSTTYNSTQNIKERVGHVYILQGKQQQAVDSVKAGDIAAVSKLKVTVTGDTLCDEKKPIIFDTLEFPKPVISFAIDPKSKGDEEKVSQALHRLCEEDPSLKIKRNDETRELIVSGMGQVHLEVMIDRLKRKFGVEVSMKSPKVPYKETIRSAAKAQGKYKKQSGGRGQYGDTWIEIEPLSRGQGFEFVDKIVGGVIPRQYIPAVEKGIQEAMEGGVIAGYPVVDIKATLYDGSYHTVDSSEMAFKIAGSMGFKKAVVDAGPVLIEPIMNMEVAVPDDCMGDVIGDLNSRRGKVLGVEPRANSQSISAQVPMAEVLKYAPDLRSITGGRGVFSMEFSHYEEVPSHLSEKIIEQLKAAKEDKK